MLYQPSKHPQRVPLPQPTRIVPDRFDEALADPIATSKARRSDRRAQRALRATASPSRKDAQWN